jgi:Thiol:disulfide interchange protein DsbD, N-terminal
MRFVAICLWLFGVPGGSSNRPVVQVQTFLATTAAHPGSTVKVAVVARIASGYHINDHKPSLDYLIPTQIIFAEAASLKVEKVIYPRGQLTKFAFLDSPIPVYEGETRFGGILRVSRSLRPGTYKLPAEFAYQACNDHACLPPAKVPFEITVRVVPPGVQVKLSNPEAFEKINFQ